MNKPGHEILAGDQVTWDGITRQVATTTTEAPACERSGPITILFTDRFELAIQPDGIYDVVSPDDLAGQLRLMKIKLIAARMAGRELARTAKALLDFDTEYDFDDDELGQVEDNYTAARKVVAGI